MAATEVPTVDAEPLPPGWRPEWCPPKRKTRQRPVAAPPVALARAREDDPELPELPSDEALEQAALHVLLDIAVNGGGADAGARVGAAKALLEAVERTSDGPRRERSSADGDALMVELLRARGYGVKEPAVGSPSASNGQW
jgi:hypothetical protein